MLNEVRRAMRDAGVAFKWGGLGNTTVMYRAPGMRYFKRFDGEKDVGRIAIHLKAEFELDDVYYGGVVEAHTWNQKHKCNMVLGSDGKWHKTAAGASGPTASDAGEGSKAADAGSKRRSRGRYGKPPSDDDHKAW